MRLEIADRGPRKESDLRHTGDGHRQREWRGKVGCDRIDRKIGEILAQHVGLAVQEVAGNVDRHIGANVTILQQQTYLGGRAGTEFNQRRAFRNDGRDLGPAIPQDRKLGAGRIVFRQSRDGLEQFRAGRVIEIFRRQSLRTLRQIIDRIAGECRGLLVWQVRFGQSGCMHVHDALQHAHSARK